MKYTPNLTRKRVVMISDYVDPDDYGTGSTKWEQEFLFNVKKTLEKLGYEFHYIETKNLEDLETELNKFNKDELIIFNWYEEIYGENNSGYKITKFLEDNKYIFTGATTKTLLTSYSKDAMKKALVNANLHTPAYFLVNSLDKLPKTINFPAIIKSDSEHGSFNISQDSIVETDQDFEHKITKYSLPVIVEEFIKGDEYTLAMIGNEDPKPLELQKINYHANKKYNLYSYAAKWERDSEDYKKTIIEACPDLNNELFSKIIEQAKKAYVAVECAGYARMEMIVRNNTVYFLDINPNPALEGEFLDAASFAGYGNGEIVLKILEFAEQFWTNKYGE